MLKSRAIIDYIIKNNLFGFGTPMVRNLRSLEDFKNRNKSY